MDQNNWKFILPAVALIVALPISQAFCAVTELGFTPLSASNEAALSSSTTSGNDQAGTFGGLEVVPPETSMLTEAIAADHSLVDFFVKDEAEEGVGDIVDEELVSVDDFGVSFGDAFSSSSHESGFWTKKKILITTGILLTVGLLFGLLAGLTGGSSGSGSGSGSGGGGGAGGNGGSNGSSGSDGDGGGSGAGDGVTVGGGTGTGILVPLLVDGSNSGGGTSDTSGFNSGNGGTSGPTGIPHSPEPATIFLLGLGLFLPFWRRRGL